MAAAAPVTQRRQRDVMDAKRTVEDLLAVGSVSCFSSLILPVFSCCAVFCVSCTSRPKQAICAGRRKKAAKEEGREGQQDLVETRRKSAEERINKPQLKLLWELQHTAPPKSRRIYQAIANCADQPKHRSRQLAPWAERVLALAEELEMPDIYTTSKREWTAQAKAALAAKHGTHWHDALQKRTKPPAPLAAAHHPMTRRTWRQPPRQPRTTGPLDFIGARITKAYSGIDHDGRIIAYDPKTRYWKCKYEDDDEEELSHAELVKHGPSDLICHPLPGTTEHTLGRYLPTRTPGSLARYITDPSLTPYQRRLWPRLITDSDLAACRSKYAPNHYQLCSCDNAPLEDAFHVLFDCARHSDSARAALLRASARCKHPS